MKKNGLFFIFFILCTLLSKAQVGTLETVAGCGFLHKGPIFDADPMRIWLNRIGGISYINNNGDYFFVLQDSTLCKVAGGIAKRMTESEGLFVQGDVQRLIFDSKGYYYGYNYKRSRIGRQDTLGGAVEWLSDSLIFTKEKYVSALFVDTLGNLYFKESYASTSTEYLYRISPSGIREVIAGNGTLGYSGDGGAATSASIAVTRTIYYDGLGNLFFQNFESGSFRGKPNGIRKIDLATGIISTVVGGGIFGYTVDGVRALGASFGAILVLTQDGAGNLYFVEDDKGVNGNLIRRVDAETGMLSTVGGLLGGKQHIDSMSKDGVMALGSVITPYASWIMIDPKDEFLYFHEFNGRIRRIQLKESVNLHEHPLPSYTFYPNPVTAQLYIKGVAVNTSYRIVDIQGRVVESGALNSSNSIELASLNRGMYVLQLAGYKSAVFEKL
jgi:hypothetical protein